MSNYLIDKVDDIAARLKEIQADKDEARKGTSAPVDGQESKTEDYPSGYGYGGMCGYAGFDFSEEKLQAAIRAAYQFGSQP